MNDQSTLWIISCWIEFEGEYLHDIYTDRDVMLTEYDKLKELKKNNLLGKNGHRYFDEISYQGYLPDGQGKMIETEDHGSWE